MSKTTLSVKSIPAHIDNYTKERTIPISEITIHHMAANSTVEQCGALWQTVGRNGSSHYGINGTNIGQYVDEADTAWCNGNWAANCRAVSIEVANSPEVSGKTYAEITKVGDKLGWPVTDASLSTLIKLVADISKRNKLHPLVFGKSLTWHSMYSATGCPGPYLTSKLQYITDEANKLNQVAENAGKPAMYGVAKQVIALSDKKKAEEYAAKLNAEDDDKVYYKVIEIN